MGSQRSRLTLSISWREVKIGQAQPDQMFSAWPSAADIERERIYEGMRMAGVPEG